MLVASYNKKYTDKEVRLDTPSGDGYGNPLSEEKSLPSSDNLTSGTAQSNIYNHGDSYWLACPSGNDTYSVRLVRYSNAYVDYNDYNASIGVRPVVCLNSGVTLTRETDGTFTIN